MEATYLKEDIFSKVAQILHQEFEVKEQALEWQSHLFEDLELDSLDAVDLVVALEKLFGFRAEEESVKKLKTVQDVVEYIHEKVNK